MKKAVQLGKTFPPPAGSWPMERGERERERVNERVREKERERRVSVCE